MYIVKPTPGYKPSLSTTEAKYHGIELVKDGTMRDVYRSEKPPFEFFGECDGQIFKYDQTEALDAVVASLAAPLPPAPKPVGRPPTYASRPKSRMVSLDEASVAIAMRLGNGNVSLGIRLALTQAENKT